MAAPRAGSGATSASLQAHLVDEKENARAHLAVVQVEVHGISLVSPFEARAPTPGEGHLHYRVDNGPLIDTAASELGFRGFSPGTHTIDVFLAGNDHTHLGPSAQLKIEVPPSQP